VCLEDMFEHGMSNLIFCFAVLVYNLSHIATLNSTRSTFALIGCLWRTQHHARSGQALTANESKCVPRRVASSSSCTSIPLAGSCTYLTTEPRMKQFLTAICQRKRRVSFGKTWPNTITYHVWMSRLINNLDSVQPYVQKPTWDLP
jgi:hypothetical protein